MLIIFQKGLNGTPSGKEVCNCAGYIDVNPFDAKSVQAPTQDSHYPKYQSLRVIKGKHQGCG